MQTDTAAKEMTTTKLGRGTDCSLASGMQAYLWHQSTKASLAAFVSSLAALSARCLALHVVFVVQVSHLGALLLLHPFCCLRCCAELKLNRIKDDDDLCGLPLCMGDQREFGSLCIPRLLDQCHHHTGVTGIRERPLCRRFGLLPLAVRGCISGLEKCGKKTTHNLS